MSKENGLNRRSVLIGGATLIAAPVIMTRLALAITPDEIKKRGKIIVGIQGDNPPFGFVNSSGVQTGLDAEVAGLYAKELGGVNIEFLPLETPTRIPALNAGRCDVLFCTMTLFPDRAKAIQFSKPYAHNVVTLVAAKTTVLKTNEDMAKLRIAVPRGSAQETQVVKNAPAGTNIIHLDTDAATVQALLSGQVDAVGGNIFYKEKLNETRPDTFEDKLEFQRVYIGAGTRLGEKEINASLNAFIDKIIANGELANIYPKWMKVPMPKFPETVEGVPFTAS